MVAKIMCLYNLFIFADAEELFSMGRAGSWSLGSFCFVSMVFADRVLLFSLNVFWFLVFLF